MVPETLVDTINVFAGESSDQDQGVLSLEDKSIQEATGKLPNPTECYASVQVLFPVFDEGEQRRSQRGSGGICGHHVQGDSHARPLFLLMSAELLEDPSDP